MLTHAVVWQRKDVSGFNIDRRSLCLRGSFSIASAVLTGKFAAHARAYKTTVVMDLWQIDAMQIDTKLSELKMGAYSHRNYISLALSICLYMSVSA